MTVAIFPRRGEIWLARTPDHAKVRPVLIVSTENRNERSTSVLAVPITSNPRVLSTHVVLLAGAGGLDVDSVARCDNVAMTLKVFLLRGPLGPPLDAATMRAIEDRLLRALAIAPWVDDA